MASLFDCTKAQMKQILQERYDAQKSTKEGRMKFWEDIFSMRYNLEMAQDKHSDVFGQVLGELIRDNLAKRDKESNSFPGIVDNFREIEDELYNTTFDGVKANMSSKKVDDAKENANIRAYMQSYMRDYVSDWNSTIGWAHDEIKLPSFSEPLMGTEGEFKAKRGRIDSNAIDNRKLDFKSPDWQITEAEVKNAKVTVDYTPEIGLKDCQEAINRFNTSRLFGGETLEHKKLREAAQTLQESLKRLNDGEAKAGAEDKQKLWEEVEKNSLAVQALAQTYVKEKEEQKAASSPAGKARLNGAKMLYRMATSLNNRAKAVYPQSLYGNLTVHEVLKTASRRKYEDMENKANTARTWKNQMNEEFGDIMLHDRDNVERVADFLAKAVAIGKLSSSSKYRHNAALKIPEKEIQDEAGKVKQDERYKYLLWQFQVRKIVYMDTASSWDMGARYSRENIVNSWIMHSRDITRILSGAFYAEVSPDYITSNQNMTMDKAIDEADMLLRNVKQNPEADKVRNDLIDQVMDIRQNPSKKKNLVQLEKAESGKKKETKSHKAMKTKSPSKSVSKTTKVPEPKKPKL